jgi:hypothetical protein
VIIANEHFASIVKNLILIKYMTINRWQEGASDER